MSLPYKDYHDWWDGFSERHRDEWAEVGWIMTAVQAAFGAGQAFGHQQGFKGGGGGGGGGSGPKVLKNKDGSGNGKKRRRYYFRIFRGAD